MPLVREVIGDEPAVVLGLPRGGVVVAAELADALACPLDVLVVRKVGVPGHRELAMGAVTAGTVVRNDDVVRAAGVTDATFDEAVSRERDVVAQRERAYRDLRAAESLEGRVAVVVDDGLATGATAGAALSALRARDRDIPARVVLAVPVGPPDTLTDLASACDDVVRVLAPRFFTAVGAWYDDFDQVADSEVSALLAAHPHRDSSARSSRSSRPR